MSSDAVANALGFIGLGQIGLPMARRLLQAGHPLKVFRARTDSQKSLVSEGAQAMSSPREVADRCDVVFLCLPSQESFREVVFAADGIVRGAALKIVVNTSTVGLMFVKEIASELNKRNIVLIDSPVSGGVPGAEAGSLSVMVSGEPGEFEKVRPYLSCWGRITVVGNEPGAAQVLKLTNNILSAVALVATSEALVMGAKAGLDPEIMLAAINKGSGRNSATEDKFPRSILNRNFDYGAKMHLLMKDIDLAIEQGEALGIPMLVCQAAQLVYRTAMSAGAAMDDVTTVARHVERAANFQIPKTR